MIPGDRHASGGAVDRDGQRSCEVCGSLSSDLLHRQPFVLPGGRLVAYDVVSCANCGFTFAKNLPPPEALEAYYRENLKYLYEGSAFVPPSLEAVHRDSFTLVDSFLREHSPPFAGTSTRVLDIGCSTGVLLSLFRQAGYEHLLGLDPAPECREVARRRHRIEGKNTHPSHSPARAFFLGPRTPGRPAARRPEHRELPARGRPSLRTRSGRGPFWL